MRIAYAAEECLTEHLERLGWLRYLRALPADPVHRHKNIEFCYLVRGRVDWSIASGQCSLHGGDLFIVQPGQVHGCEYEVLGRCEYYWMRLRFPPGLSLAGMSLQETEDVQCRLSAITTPCCRGSKAIESTLARLFAEHRQRRSDSHFVARAALTELLIHILRAVEGAVDRASEGVSSRIRNAVTVMEKNLDQSISIQELARDLEMNPQQFRLEFLAHTGQLPSDYLLRRRIDRALHLLRESDMSITEIAAAMGYSSSQYLATSFKKVVGLSPNEYRQRISAGTTNGAAQNR